MSPENTGGKRSMKKKAIFLVSVGTSQTTALQNTTLRLRDEIEEKYNTKCYVGYSSQFILNKMKAKDDSCQGIAEAMETMLSDGVEEITVQPTFLLNGVEKEDMLEQMKPYREKFAHISFGKPLFSEKADYIRTLQAILDEVKPAEDEALVLIGHGTNHQAGTAYQNLEYTAYTQGMRNVFVGTMSGEKSERMTLRKLGVSGYRKVRLMPLLFVAGFHAKRDIDGGERSWRSILEEAGYEVTAQLTGLGEMAGVRSLYMEHLEVAAREKDAEA